MTNSAAAREYAKALFMLARRSDRIEGIAGDFAAFIDLLNANAHLKLFLMAPQVGAARKSEVFRKALEGKVDEYFLKFLLVVIEKRRQDGIEQMASAYHEELNLHYDRVEVSAATAVALSDKERTEFMGRLAKHLGKNVSLSTRVEPRLLGGLVCRIGDVVYDASLRRRIDRLFHQMLKAQ